MAKKRPRRNKNKKRAAERLQRLRQRAKTSMGLACAGALVLLVSALFVFVHDLLVSEGSFPLERITITGAKRLSESAVARRADVQQGANILAVNLSRVRKRLISHPWIADAHVRREIPAGLGIRIREHQCRAVVDLGDQFLMNTAGLVFKTYEPGSDPKNLPVIRGLSAADVEVANAASSGKRYSWPRSAEAGHLPPEANPWSAVMEVLKLGGAADSTVPNHQIRQIRVDRPMGLTLSAFAQEKVIHLGYGNYSRKYRILAAILARAENNRLVPEFNHIDLRDINRIVIKPVKQDPSG